MDKRHLKRIRRQDRCARWLITIGGVSVIFCVLTMLVLIAGTALPLFRPARLTVASACPLPAATGGAILAIGVDDYRETGFVVDERGVFAFFDVRSGQRLDESHVEPPQPGAQRILAARHDGDLRFALLWDNGGSTLVGVTFASDFSGPQRRITHRVATLATFAPQPGEPVPLALALRATEESSTAVTLLDRRRLAVRRQAVAADDGAEAPPAAQSMVITDIPEDITVFALDREGRSVYAGTERGTLLRWDISGDAPQALERRRAFADHRPVTALGLVFGDVSLAVGDAQGGVTTWSPVALYGAGSDRQLAPMRTLSTQASAVAGFLFTVHDKSVISLGADGTVQLDHMTSNRHLLTLRPQVPLRQVQLSLQGDSLIGLDAEQQVRVWRVRNPHPDVSWRMLFGKTWYENYDQPAFVWQSSSANDDSEAKYSFIPLVFGSLKGTFYALLFAVPVALLGALYTSQFTTYETRGIIKPAVEIMAAIPSVVIGFLAALWLAPRLERAIVAVFLYALALPLSLALFIAVWSRLRHLRLAKRIERGYEFLMAVPILLLAGLLAYLAAPGVERVLFHGDFKLWLFQEAGTRFDPRNSIVIAFALGFAVIPIIFTIAEDALANVPKSLKAASLALGASRWQTAWRVVLPSASPGVFAGIIIGFGRAVGETMIVLMATGNTPILDAGLFSGMRTLSANIAVEIPEAPAGGTLFRVLFLSAVLLFLLTSVLNTAAELIRHRLRKRYGY
jgi:phosphate transport system permease protein